MNWCDGLVTSLSQREPLAAFKCPFCPSPDVLSRGQSKLLEGLDIVPRHAGPISVERYEAIRLYLIKVSRAAGL